MYLLGSRHGWPGRRSLWELVESGVLRFAPERRDDGSRVAQLMAKYRDMPMALVDAQLMPLAEDPGRPPIFTLEGDFAIYGLADGSAPTLVPY
jgi:predicted nucleic acid-binding protein